jgi:hypothetical protein
MIIKLKRQTQVPSTYCKSSSPFGRGHKMQLSSAVNEVPTLDIEKFELEKTSKNRVVVEPLDNRVAARVKAIEMRLPG